MDCAEDGTFPDTEAADQALACVPSEADAAAAGPQAFHTISGILLLTVPLFTASMKQADAQFLTDEGISVLCLLYAMRPQMMHTLLPGGLLLHADAPKAFCSQLQREGTLPLMKVNVDASSAAKRLEVSLSHLPPGFSFQHAQTRLDYYCPPPHSAM